MLGDIQDSKFKEIVLKYKTMVSDISKKCLFRLYDRQETADVSMNALEKLELETK